ncbi:MAG: lysophospholipid acyltransferase family protein [Marinilabiliaceae bacterium]
MNKFIYYIWYPLIYVISMLPFSVLYRISDFLYHPLTWIGYRKQVVLGNLKKAFPDKDDEWRKDILEKFYRHFCDLVIETIKLQHIPDREIEKRISFSNTEFIDQATDKGKDVIAVLGHYGNWEWVPAINLHIKAKGYSVYRPLKDKSFDRYMLELRSRFGSGNVTMKNTMRMVARLRKANERFVLGLIADQSPSKSSLHYWTTFLTQRTPIIMGPEKMARAINGAVVYFKVTKPRRGHYHIKVVPWPKDITTAPENEMTEWHVRQLEQSIYERPELWLWSHKRWKYQHMYQPKNDH